MKQKLVYVIGADGKPFMPTRRYGKVRRLLKTGKAKAVTTIPFTIRLLYQPETAKVQDVILGIDPGRTNIGLAAVTGQGRCLYSAHCTTRNKEIPELMRNRKKHRMASRRGERLARKRLAKKLGTTVKTLMERRLPGCEKPVCVKDIINTESKFTNRVRPSRWLTPTARQLLQTHFNLMKGVQKILPVSGVVLEQNEFAFMQLQNPGKKLTRQDYESGLLKGYRSVNEAVDALQDGSCLLCGRKIEHHHHIRPLSRRGSDTIANVVGLCRRCHEEVHTSPKARKRLKDQKDGLSRQFAGTSVLNQIIPALSTALEDMFGDRSHATHGWETMKYRETHQIQKDHDLDAYCIACSAIKTHGNGAGTETPAGSYEIMQFRRHDRAHIHSQRERNYYLDGERVAMNRKARFEQLAKHPSLEDWYAAAVEQYGTKEAQKMRSQLTVKKSERHYNNPERHLPGTLFLYHGKRYVMKGQQDKGFYVYAFDGVDGKTGRIPAKECTFYGNNGLVYVA